MAHWVCQLNVYYSNLSYFFDHWVFTVFSLTCLCLFQLNKCVLTQQWCIFWKIWLLIIENICHIFLLKEMWLVAGYGYNKLNHHAYVIMDPLAACFSGLDSRYQISLRHSIILLVGWSQDWSCQVLEGSDYVKTLETLETAQLIEIIWRENGEGDCSYQYH